MRDYAKLKELAEAANAVTSDVNITVAVGTTQEEVAAIQGFLQIAMPKSILALLAELEQLKVGLERAKLIGRLAYNFDGYKQVLDERAQLKAEHAHLKKQEIEVKAECEGLRVALMECSDSLHGEMLQKFGGQLPDDMHPVTRREYDRDMAEVAEYRAAMGRGERS